ncbi:hypothetical protein AQ436_16230 [Arthrobacter sp. EpRS66]|nr:hypothetical protein AQ436_16230 [Arthrobacter sp. EpRS66]
MDLTSTLPFIAGLVIITFMTTVMAPQMKSGKLQRNSAIGIKTRHTQSSDQAWEQGHLSAAPWVQSASWTGWTLLIAVTILCLVDRVAMAFGITALGYVLCIGLLLISGRQANIAAKQY